MCWWGARVADVQLEHGHVRIANRLYEAFLDADFTPTQFKILHVLVRLSFGWSRRTVTVSHAELAAAGGLAPSGAFRAALHQLIAEGVVLRLEQGTGATKSTLAIQKDFTKWGRWAIHPDRLATRYGVRPEANDSLLAKPEAAVPGVPAGEGARTQAPRVPEERQAGCLNAGTPTGSKSNSGETVGPRKDSESQGQTAPPSPPPARASEPGEGHVSRQRLLGKLTTERSRVTVQRFLDAAEAAGHNPGYWVDEIASWFDGLGMPRLRPMLEEDVVAGLHDYLGGRDQDFSPRHVRSFPPSAQRARIKRDAPVDAQPAPAARPAEHWRDRQAREQREAELQARVKFAWPNVEQRRAKDDGDRWWARMQQEAGLARAHPILYAVEHTREPADPTELAHAS
jgi:phage replication O-like protein O